MQGGDAKLNSKIYLSSDCTLQLECMKLESLVIVDQRATVNTFPGLVHTARHTMEVGSTLKQIANRKEASVDSHSFAVAPRAKGVFGMALRSFWPRVCLNV